MGFLKQSLWLFRLYSQDSEQCDHFFQSEQVADDVGAELEEENETDDWEGVESTDLERLFGAASTYADNMVAMFGVKPSTDAMLQLQALYKIATEGPCSTSQPSAFQPSARAKW